MTKEEAIKVLDMAIKALSTDTEKPKRKWLVCGIWPDVTYKCPYCGTEFLDGDYEFCLSCGAKMEAEK